MESLKIWNAVGPKNIINVRCDLLSDSANSYGDIVMSLISALYAFTHDVDGKISSNCLDEFHRVEDSMKDIVRTVSFCRYFGRDKMHKDLTAGQILESYAAAHNLPSTYASMLTGIRSLYGDIQINVLADVIYDRMMQRLADVKVDGVIVNFL